MTPKPRSPLPLRQVLHYLQIEDVDHLIPGSVKYVGSAVEGGVRRHYWSYPCNGVVSWVCLDTGLGTAEEVPADIRAMTASYEAHPRRIAKRGPKKPWIGRNLPEGSKPAWIPASSINQINASFAVAFQYDFERLAAIFGATPSTDKFGGGAGPCRYFLLELPRNRIAMLESCKAYNQIHLHLPESRSPGTCYWDDYFAIIDPLGLELEQVFRQGGIDWKHRTPTPEALERTRDHQRRMWIPR